MSHSIQLPISSLPRLRLPPICAVTGTRDDVVFKTVACLAPGHSVSVAHSLVDLALSLTVGVITGLFTGVAVIPGSERERAPQIELEVPFSRALVKRRERQLQLFEIGLGLLVLALIPALISTLMTHYSPPQGDTGGVILRWALFFGASLIGLSWMVSHGQGVGCRATKGGELLLEVPDARAAEEFARALRKLPRVTIARPVEGARRRPSRATG